MNEIIIWKVDVISYGVILDTFYFGTEELVENHINSTPNMDLEYDVEQVTVYTTL